jgi:hypothetical protein
MQLQVGQMLETLKEKKEITTPNAATALAEMKAELAEMHMDGVLTNAHT